MSGKFIGFSFNLEGIGSILLRYYFMAQKFPSHLTSLISNLKKLPGIGTKTAERFAFELITWNSSELQLFSEILKDLKDKVPRCTTCGCLADPSGCRFCANRDTNTLCIIASAKDAYAMEEACAYKGLYHVIEHLISPLDGRSAHLLRLDKIKERIQTNGVKELIIALDSTLEGDATALYLKNELADANLCISRLAFGLPVGHSLEYVDGGTLARALIGRQTI
jgi:recombination protein RecR